MYGLDISNWQSKNIIKQINDKAKFIIIRDGWGTYSKDPSFDGFITDAISKGLDIGIYHASYSANIQEAKQEAELVLKHIEPYKEHITMPIYFDFEYFSSDYILKNSGTQTTSQLVQSLTETFCNTIIDAGFKPGFYSNLDYINRFYTQNWIDNHKQYSFWYARPGLNKPDKVCDIWQYAVNNGSEFNYDKDIDKNFLYNTNIIKKYKPNTEIATMIKTMNLLQEQLQEMQIELEIETNENKEMMKEIQNIINRYCV